MRFAYHGFYGQNHSWAVVAQNLTRSLIHLGNEVDVFSTNGIAKVPIDLSSSIRGHIEGDMLMGKPLGSGYDGTLSYTALKNAEKYLGHSDKNRFLIWCYEFAGFNALPPGFAKAHQHVDLILPPSNFAKQVFIDSGVPSNKLHVLSHGINSNEISSAEPYKLKTKKSIKFLINLGQIHRRKNLAGALEMWGKAFSSKDDVVLVLKVQDKSPKYVFELSFQTIFQEFKGNFPDHAEIEIVREFIPNIYSLYKSCDITFSPSNTEGFGMVPLEGMACGLIPIASRYGGFLDFLNDDNAMLIDGKEFSVPGNYLYYHQKLGTKAFRPDMDSGIATLRQAARNFSSLKSEAEKTSQKIIEKYSWLRITEQMISLTK